MKSRPVSGGVVVVLLSATAALAQGVGYGTPGYGPGYMPYWPAPTTGGQPVPGVPSGPPQERPAANPMERMMAPMNEMARPVEKMMGPMQEMMPGASGDRQAFPPPGIYGATEPPRAPDAGAKDPMGRMMAPMGKMMEPMQEMAPPLDKMMSPMREMMGEGDRQVQPPPYGPPPGYPTR